MTRPLQTLALAFVIVTSNAAAPAADLLADLQRADEDARAALAALATAALTGQTARARALADTIAGAPPLRPLAPRARLLAVAAVRPTVTRHAALEALLDESLDDETETVATHFAALDDATAARRLLVDDRYDRSAHLVNDALRPFGLGPHLLAVANPILLAGSALDTILTTTSNLLRYDDLSVREREALARYRQAARRDPARLRHEAAADRIRTLRRRSAEDTCETLGREVKRLLREDDLERARYRVHSPLAAACDEPLTTRRRETEARVDAAARAAEAQRWPVHDVARPATAEGWQAYGAVAAAIVRRDPGRIEQAAGRLLASDEDGPFAPGARLALALARHVGGDEPGADALLGTVAGSDDSAGRAAAGLQAAGRRGRQEALAAAQRQHSRDVMRYVVLGPRLVGRSAVHGAARLAAYGAAGAQTLGITNAVGVLTRGWRAWRQDPASNARIIDEGEAYLDRHPGGDAADQIRGALVEAYAREARYGRALMHAKARRDPDPKQIAKLEERLAASEVARARGAGSVALLHAVSRRFPDTDAAGEARDLLASGAARGELQIPREALESNADLLGPSGLDLPPGLLDGDRGNGELTDEGVAVTPTGISLSLAGENGPVTDTRTLDDADLLRLHATAQQILYERALGASGDAEMGRWERWIPLYVTGAVGDHGVTVTPGLKPRPHRPEHPERYQ